MSGNTQSPGETVDLTMNGPETRSINREGPKRTWRRPSRANRNNQPSATDDFEIVDVQPSESPRKRRAQESDESDIQLVSQSRSKRSLRRSQPSSGGDIDIVAEHTLTAQERLQQIQARHARGETVPVAHAVDNSHPPTSFWGLNSLFRNYTHSHSSRGTAQARLNNIQFPDINPDQLSDPFGEHEFRGPLPSFLPSHYGHAHEQPSWRFRSRPGGVGGHIIRLGAGPADTVNSILERSILERALETSVDDTHRRVNMNSVRFPKAPAKTREGFVHSLQNLKEKDSLVCICCGMELGSTPQKSDDKSLSAHAAQIFVRGCGHVYCGDCTYSFKSKSRNERKCPVAECQKIKPKKRHRFVQAYV